MTRYARQIVLPEIGEEGQARLLSGHVAVVGAGGLGCPALQYLAGAGVGRMTLFDPDHVEESNLHRQPLFDMQDLGKPKARAAQIRLSAAYPDTQIEARIEALNPSNAPALVQNADLVIDAADSYAVSYILSDTCLKHNTPLISASALGQTGYVGGFCKEVPSLRAVFPDPPANAARCETAGVMGPVVGILGAMQAQMALKVLLDHVPSVLGRIVTVDMNGLNFGGFTFANAPEPEEFFPFISAADITSGDHLIELRDTLEAPMMVRPNAQRMTMEGLEVFAPEPDERVVLCCASGLRAWRGARVLRARGYRALALLATRAA